jgi:hypothetical protein
MISQSSVVVTSLGDATGMLGVAFQGMLSWAIFCIILGQLTMMVVGFVEKPRTGCLLTLLGPLGCLILFIEKPKATWLPFSIMCIGIGYIIGLVIYVKFFSF